MSATHRFRFGVVCGAPDAASWTALARRAEELGYSIFLNSDHLDTSGAHVSLFAPLSALGAAAAVTTRLRIGTSVLNQDLRHPAVLAREAATLDVLSDGRFELGLGAGWAEYEYRWAGIHFDPASVRIARLAEYIAVVKALLEQDVASFDGDFFNVTEMPGLPRPVQVPRPKLLLGGTFKRMLQLAAREGDIVSVMHTHPAAATAAAMDRRIEWIREAAGSRFDQIELNTIIGNILIAESGRDELLRRHLAQAPVELRVGLSEEEFADSPIALIGSADGVCDQLVGWRERWGLSYVIITDTHMEQFAPVVERLSGR